MLIKSKFSESIRRLGYPRFVNLTRHRVQLRGQLYPLSVEESEAYGTPIGLLTDQGQRFFVVGRKRLHQSLLNHLWDHVFVEGDANYTDQSLIIRDFHQEERLEIASPNCQQTLASKVSQDLNLVQFISSMPMNCALLQVS